MIHLIYVVRSTCDDSLEAQKYDTRRAAESAADALEHWGVGDVVIEMRHAHAWDDFEAPAFRCVPRGTTYAHAS